MNLLAIDTSTRAQVLGLMIDDVIVDATQIVGRAHSQLILPSIMAMLTDARLTLPALDGIVFGAGPGSFTGLRIAVGVVQGLAYGLSIPVVPVSTLACLAQGEYRRSGATHIVVAQSARKQEVFFGSFVVTDAIASLQGRESVFDADKVPAQAFDDCVGIGDGWQFREALERALQATATAVSLDVLPEVVDLLRLGAVKFEAGQSIDAMSARPEYLREQVATPGSANRS